MPFSRPDSANLRLLILTLVGLVLRLYLNIGFALGDDGAYAYRIHEILNHGYPEIGQVGQYEYRPLWLLPNSLSIYLFGWGDLGLSFYSLVCGALIPLVTSVWLRIYTGRESAAPLLCCLILSLYPSLFVDSLMMVNETPMILFYLLSTLCLAFGLRAAAPSGGEPSRWNKALVQFSLSGLFFACAYQVKISALPIAGLLLLAELCLFLLLANPNPHHLKRALPFILAICLWLIPSVVVQGFYWIKTGSPIGNYTGENQLYLNWVPPEYEDGTMNLDDCLSEYKKQLFLPNGYEGFRYLLHGLWAWLAVLGGGVVLFIQRRLERPLRWPLIIVLLCGLLTYLFLQYWPSRLSPYYLPNCFSGRPWRYLDVLAPLIACFCSLLLTLPWWERRVMTRRLNTLLTSLCFLVAGYSLVVRHHDMNDRNSDFRKAAVTCETLLKPYLSLPHFCDNDATPPLWIIHKFSPRMQVINSESTFINLQDTPKACLWTGGARREGTDGLAAWSAKEITCYGGKFTLLYSWAAAERPWRRDCLQLWLYTRTP